MFKIDYNPVSKRWHERVDVLPKEKIDLINSPVGKENLLVLKKSKELVKDGDVFVVSPKEGIYFWGRVLLANIKHIEQGSWYNGCHVIFIFKCKTRSKDIKEFKPNYNDLLINPDIVTSDYWKKGWFETVCNIPLSEEEKMLDYGFYSKDFIGINGTFKKANGELLDHIPKLFNLYGVATFSAIYRIIKTEIIIDPLLIE